MKQKSRRLDKVKLLKEMGRERVGSPKATRPIKSKKKVRLEKALMKDLLDV